MKINASYLFEAHFTTACRIRLFRIRIASASEISWCSSSSYSLCFPEASRCTNSWMSDSDLRQSYLPIKSQMIRIYTQKWRFFVNESESESVKWMIRTCFRSWMNQHFKTNRLSEWFNESYIKRVKLVRNCIRVLSEWQWLIDQWFTHNHLS